MGLKPRQWVILLTFYTIYLMFGASVFYHIEHAAETDRRSKELQDRMAINELLVSFTSPDDLQVQDYILKRLSSYCNKPVTSYDEDEFVPPYQWTFYHSVFFAFIVCSTLGYGNITPSGTLGRYFMIGYALIGMPVNMILFTYLGEYFGKGFIKVYNKYKSFKMANNEDYAPGRLSMIGQITLALIPAAIILIFLPSCLFTYFEGWPYSISVYYSFVTLLTIGFGDYVPTFQAHQEETFGIYFKFYQIFVLVWFVFGLSYILMLIGFIARGMQSKKITRLEQQLTDNIKLTHNRIWNEVSKDVGYLRRILNEVYIMRFRPVYAEPTDVTFNSKLNRSQSCPDLSIFSCKSPIARRKRAFSENYFNEERPEQPTDLRQMPALSRHSETNLLYIDKEKTFNPQTILDNTGDLLAQVVMALNTFNADEIDNVQTGAGTGTAAATGAGGVDLFSDRSILEDEWSIVTSSPHEHQKPPTNPRLRSKSLYPGQLAKVINSDSMTPQFTWSCNNNDIQDYINAQVRHNASKANKDGNNVVINVDKIKDGTAAPSRRKSIFNAFNNVFKRRGTMAAIESAEAPTDQTDPKPFVKSAISPVTERRASIKPNAGRKPQFNLESNGRRPSIMSNQSTTSDHILENTTIADLIRAIETAHVKNLLGDITGATTSKPNNFLSNRRFSMAPAAMTTKRRNSVTFATNIPTPPIAGSNRFPMSMPMAGIQGRRASISISQSPHGILRQNSNPNRFSVEPVSESPKSAVSLSPIIQRRMRRFSVAPSTTMTPSRNSNLSAQTTPHALRRFKQPISPLAMNSGINSIGISGPSFGAPSTTLKSVEEPIEQPENENE